jgi:hypothetical protein
MQPVPNGTTCERCPKGLFSPYGRYCESCSYGQVPSLDQTVSFAAAFEASRRHARDRRPA